MINELAIEVFNLTKSYKIYNKPIDIILEMGFGKGKYIVQNALEDVSFSINKGEIVGVVGSNGAGKSTLLKIISKKLQQSKGSVETNGKISALLELGAGFHMRYSGRENIFMGALCLGIDKKEIYSKLDEIIEFSELKDVIDQPFYTYSSGMQARLTFSVGVCSLPDIFIVDEALATGDASFSRKCLNKIREICDSGTTALFVSHSTQSLIQLCQRIIWLDKGRIVMDGKAIDVARSYEEYMHYEYNAKFYKNKINRNQYIDNAKKESGAPFSINKVEFLNDKNESASIFRFWTSLTIKVYYSCNTAYKKEVPFPGLAVAIHRIEDMVCVTAFNSNMPNTDEDLSHHMNQEASQKKHYSSKGCIDVLLSHIQLNPGEYFVSLGILKNNVTTSEFYDYRHLAYPLNIIRNGCDQQGVFYHQVKWSHKIISPKVSV